MPACTTPPAVLLVSYPLAWNPSTSVAHITKAADCETLTQVVEPDEMLKLSVCEMTRRRLNHERTHRNDVLSSNIGPVPIRTIPTSVRVSSPDLISTPMLPAVLLVVWPVVENSSVNVPALL